MGLLKEFKDFAVKGNVIDLAVAVIIGAEFGKIVSSLVKDVIMPPIGKLLNNVNFTDLFVTLDGSSYDTLAAAQEAGAPVLSYGNFIQALVNFTIIAFVVFMLVRTITKLKKKEAAAPSTPPPTPEDIVLLREIRDSLKK